MKLSLIATLTLGLSCWAFSARSCPIIATDHQLTATSAKYNLAIVAAPLPIRVGQAFSLALIVCDEQNQGFSGIIKATARMPLHNHGMNYQPSATALGKGKFVLDGFLFHLPGQWQFSFDLRDGELMDRIQIKYLLEQ